MQDTEVVEAPAELDLPAMPEIEFSIRRRRDAGKAAGVLAELICDGLLAAR